MNNKRFWNVVIVAFSLPVLFAILDVIGAGLWMKVGGWESQAYVIGGHIYQYAFWSLAYALIIGIAITYYLVKKDKSEALALVIIPAILLQCGVEDVIFYWLKGLNVFQYTMPWLMENLWPPTIITYITHQPVITGSILFFTACVGILVSWKVAKHLEKVDG